MYYHSLSITVWGEVGNALKNNRKKQNTNSICKCINKVLSEIMGMHG